MIYRVNNNPAIIKYSKTPNISILVVTNGPVATAGSISNFLKISGVKVPTAVARSIEEHILSPPTTPYIGSEPRNLKFANTPSIIPYNTPSINPTLSSFKSTLNSFPISILPVAIPLTIIVED